MQDERTPPSACDSSQKHHMQSLAEDDCKVLNTETGTRTLPFERKNKNSGMEDSQRFKDHIETGCSNLAGSSLTGNSGNRHGLRSNWQSVTAAWAVATISTSCLYHSHCTENWTVTVCVREGVACMLYMSECVLYM